MCGIIQGIQKKEFESSPNVLELLSLKARVENMRLNIESKVLVIA